MEKRVTKRRRGGGMKVGTSVILQTMKWPSLPHPSVELIERETTMKRIGMKREIEPMAPFASRVKTGHCFPYSPIHWTYLYSVDWGESEEDKQRPFIGRVAP